MTPAIDYIRIEADILSRSDLGDKAKILLGLIQSFNSKGLFLSNQTLGELLGSSGKNISRILAELSQKKLIEIENGMTCKRKIYLRKSADVKDSDLRKTAPEPTQKCAGTSAELRNITKRTKETESLFARFWEIYPHKVSQPQAKKAFEKLGPDEALLKVMLAALEKYKNTEQWQSDGGRYIPYPAKWLSEKRWQDEILTVDDQRRAANDRALGRGGKSLAEVEQLEKELGL